MNHQLSRSAQQLAEVLTRFASASSHQAAAQSGIERIAESFEAEVGAVVLGGRVVAAVGFPAERVPECELLQVAEAATEAIYVPGVGMCRTVSVPIPTNPTGQMVLARQGCDGFDLDELSLLRSMARILATVLDMQTLLAERKQAEIDLAEARDQAREASQLKSQFLANASHEIRTPMTVIVGLTELLEDTGLDATQRKFVDGLRRANESLLSIINDILDFSKIEAGRLDLETSEFEPRQVVEDVGDLLGETARTKGLELVSYCEPNVPPVVLGDAGRLLQVVLNLASNAVKFTDAGEVVIRASEVKREGNRSVVRIDVTDTGIGIAQRDRRRLFQPFSQVDASTTRRYGGTGLGLAICRQLTEAMAGTIGVDSEPGVGSTFWVEIPFTMAARPPAAGGLDPRFRDLRVLVVDDNETSRTVLRNVLAGWGMQPDTAPDASAALRTLERAAVDGHGYDVALIDRYMPGIGGLELTRRIRARPLLSATRLVLLASSSAVDDEGATAAGIRACLPKPVRRSQLQACLSAAVASASR